MEFVVSLVVTIALILSNDVFKEVLANVCYVGQEQDGAQYRWVLDSDDPCECTKIRLGGINIKTPASGSFKRRYTNGLVLGSDVHEIRKWLNCPQKTTEKPANVTVNMCSDVTFTLATSEKTRFLPIALDNQFIWALSFRLSHNMKGNMYLSNSEDERSRKYKIVIEMNAIELREYVSEMERQLKRHDTGINIAKHHLSIGNGKFALDLSHVYSLSTIDLNGIGFVQFDCESGVDCVWTLFNVPCSWQ